MTKAEQTTKQNEEVISRLRADRAKMDTIVKDEKKNYEKLNFDILSAQTLIGTLKESYSLVEKKLKEGSYSLNNLVTSKAKTTGTSSREQFKNEKN